MKKKAHYTKSNINRMRGIPIQSVIVDVLKMPTKTRPGGYIQFRCPKCHGDTTGVREKTNTAVCVDCDAHFNPIDIVMEHEKISFKEAADLLYGLSGRRLNQKISRR